MQQPLPKLYMGLAIVSGAKDSPGQGFWGSGVRAESALVFPCFHHQHRRHMCTATHSTPAPMCGLQGSFTASAGAVQLQTLLICNRAAAPIHGLACTSWSMHRYSRQPQMLPQRAATAPCSSARPA